MDTVFWAAFAAALASALEHIEERVLERRPMAALRTGEQPTLLYVGVTGLHAGKRFDLRVQAVFLSRSRPAFAICSRSVCRNASSAIKTAYSSRPVWERAAARNVTKC